MMPSLLKFIFLGFLLYASESNAQDSNPCNKKPCKTGELCLTVTGSNYVCVSESTVEREFENAIGGLIRNKGIKQNVIAETTNNAKTQPESRIIADTKVDDNDAQILQILLGGGAPTPLKPKTPSQPLNTRIGVARASSKSINNVETKPKPTSRINGNNNDLSQLAISRSDQNLANGLPNSNQFPTSNIRKVPTVETPISQKPVPSDINGDRVVGNSPTPLEPTRNDLPTRPIGSNPNVDKDLEILQFLDGEPTTQVKETVQAQEPIEPVNEAAPFVELPKTSGTTMSPEDADLLNNLLAPSQNSFQPNPNQVVEPKRPLVPVEPVETVIGGALPTETLNRQPIRIPQSNRQNGIVNAITVQPVQIPDNRKPTQKTTISERLRERLRTSTRVNPTTLDGKIKEAVETETSRTATTSAPPTIPSPRIETYCLGFKSGDQIPHPSDSKKFIVCQAADFIIMNCPATLVYNRFLNRCDRTELEPQRACLASPCKNNGNCSDTENYGFVCECEEGFSGDTCDKRADPCLNNPCSPGGVCTSLDAFKFLPVKYYCLCDGGNSYGSDCGKNRFVNPCIKYHTEAYYSSQLSRSLFIHCESDIMNIKTCHQPLIWSQRLLTCTTEEEDLIALDEEEEEDEFDEY